MVCIRDSPDSLDGRAEQDELVRDHPLVRRGGSPEARGGRVWRGRAIHAEMVPSNSFRLGVHSQQGKRPDAFVVVLPMLRWKYSRNFLVNQNES